MPFGFGRWPSHNGETDIVGKHAIAPCRGGGMGQDILLKAENMEAFWPVLDYTIAQRDAATAAFAGAARALIEERKASAYPYLDVLARREVLEDAPADRCPTNQQAVEAPLARLRQAASSGRSMRYTSRGGSGAPIKNGGAPCRLGDTGAPPRLLSDPLRLRLMVAIQHMDHHRRRYPHPEHRFWSIGSGIRPHQQGSPRCRWWATL